MRAYLGIGTNQGNRKENLRQSIVRLEAVNGIQIVKISSIYETEPWGVKIGRASCRERV